MNRNRAPCQGCPHREVGCHGKCAIYQEWLVLRKKRIMQRRAEREVRDYEIKNQFFRQDGPKGR